MAIGNVFSLLNNVKVIPVILVTGAVKSKSALVNRLANPLIPDINPSRGLANVNGSVSTVVLAVSKSGNARAECQAGSSDFLPLYPGTSCSCII